MQNILFTLLIWFIVQPACAIEHNDGLVKNSGVKFIPNKGQLADANNHFRADLFYRADVSNGSVFLGADFLSHVLVKFSGISEEDHEMLLANNLDTTPVLSIHRVDVHFEGANVNPIIRELQPSKDYSNYYFTHCPDGVLNVKSYSKLVYQNVYPNIDFVYYGGRENEIKYDIVLHPGANPENIKMKITGADNILVNDDNSLSIETSLGTIHENMPKVYIKDGDKIKDIKCSYILNREDNVISFQLGKYDRSKTLVIDPTTWVTYLGGTYPDAAQDIATDNNGNAYVTGLSTSANFPLTTGAFQTTLKNVLWMGGMITVRGDGVVSKFDPDGNLLWSTYYGGTNADWFLSIATDPNTNDVAIIGHCGSNDFPVTAGAYQTASAGGADIVVVKFNPSGGRIWSTYYGGSGKEFSEDIAIDRKGNVAITGETQSNNLPVPNGFQTTYGGTNPGFFKIGDAFIAKLNSTGSSLVFGSYYGANGSGEAGWGVTVDKQDNIIFVGQTDNTALAPTNTGVQPSNAGAEDAFIIKLDPNGSPLWGTYYGTINSEGFYDVKTDASDNIFAAGNTSGNNSPVLCIKYSPTGSRIASYIPNNIYTGGIGSSVHCAVDKYNDVYLFAESEGGATPIKQFSVSNSCSYITTGVKEGDDAQYLIKLNNNLKVLCTSYWPANSGWGHYELGAYTTPSGGCDNGGGGIACWNGFVYTTLTVSQKYPVTAGAFQTKFGGSENDFAVSKLCGMACSGIPNFAISFNSSQQNICTGQAVNFFSSFNSCDTNNILYQWTFAGATPSTSTQKNPTGIVYATNGMFDVKLVVTTPCGDDSIITPTYINVNGPIATIASQNNISCNGANNGAIFINVNSGTPAYNYSWSNNSTNTSVSNLSPGTYSVVVSDAMGCNDTVTTTITEPTKLMAFIPSQNNVACFGDSTGSAAAFALGGTTNYSYSWNTFPAQLNANASGLQAGNYMVTITDANNCTASASAVITEPPVLSISIASKQDVQCFGNNNGIVNTISVGGTTPYTYLWSNSQTGINATGLVAGNYSVVVTDAFGCFKTETVSISQPAQIITAVNKQDESCSGKKDGMVNAVVSGGIPGYNYSWSNGQLVSSMSNLTAGLYTLTVTDAANCIDTAQVYINASVAITFTLTTIDNLCYGTNNGSATVQINGGTPGYRYTWSNGDTTTTVNNLAAGNYSLTVTDMNQCNISVNATITQPNAITIHLPAQSAICAGAGAQVSALVGGGTPGYIYMWNNGQTGSVISVNPLQQTVYTLTVVDANNCIANDSTSVVVNVLPVVSFASDKQEACAPACITFSNTTSNTSVLMWQFENGITQNGNTINNCYSAAGVYGVTLTVTDNNGCSNSIDSANFIVIHPSPVAAFTSSPNPTTILNPTIQFTNQSQGYVSSNWTFGDVLNGSSIAENPSYTYSDTGNYSVLLMVTNEYGCSDTANDIVEILPDFSIYIPNSFTPNADNKNDVFLPIGVGIEIKNYQLLIFDRWGDLIFESNDPSKGWDGRANNGSVQAQIDTYVWKVRATGVTGERKQYSGAVNLIR